MELGTVLLYPLLLAALLGGLGLVVLKNPVHGAVSLLFTMLALALTYAMLNAHLLAALQIIIYAGAIVVLVVYIIMLLDVRTEDATLAWRPRGKFAIPAALGLVVLLGAAVSQVPGTAPAALSLRDGDVPREGSCTDYLDGDGDRMIDCGDLDCGRHSACYGTVRAVGAQLLGPYVLPFEVSSILLLGGIVAALLLTTKHHKDVAPSAEPGTTDAA